MRGRRLGHGRKAVLSALLLFEALPCTAELVPSLLIVGVEFERPAEVLFRLVKVPHLVRGFGGSEEGLDIGGLVRPGCLLGRNQVGQGVRDGELVPTQAKVSTSAIPMQGPPEIVVPLRASDF